MGFRLGLARWDLTSIRTVDGIDLIWVKWGHWGPRLGERKGERDDGDLALVIEATGEEDCPRWRWQQGLEQQQRRRRPDGVTLLAGLRCNTERAYKKNKIRRRIRCSDGEFARGSSTSEVWEEMMTVRHHRLE